MVGRHRTDNERESTDKLYPLLDHRWADIIISVCGVLIMIPFGITAVVVAVVTVLLAWLV